MVSPNRPGYTTYETPTEREIDPRPGGKWRYVWRKGDGANMAMEGDFREIAPPERLVTSESWGLEWPETINTLVLTETVAQTGMKDGMDQGFARLDELVGTLS